MSHRSAFQTGAALGAGIAIGVLADNFCDVTGRLALAAAPLQRAAYRRQVDRYHRAHQRATASRVGPCTGLLPDLSEAPE